MTSSSPAPVLRVDPAMEGELRSSLTGAGAKLRTVGLFAILLLALYGLFFDTQQALQSYLVAYLFALGFCLGSLGLLYLHNATGGAWGVAIRRPLEAAAGTLPLLAVLFLPVLVGVETLYPWAPEEARAGDLVLQHKEPFLNVRTFVVCTLLYFGIWLWLLRRVRPVPTSANGVDAYPTRGQRRMAGFGLALYVLSMTFAAFHWAMSLEPHWFSTIYGLSFAVGQVLSALALATHTVARLSGRPPLQGFVSRDQFHDLGNLTLALVMLWAYVALSQFLIIWSANLAEEAPWYLARSAHGWQALVVFLIVFHFAMPFAVLLSRRAKRAPAVLGTLALVLIALRAFDLFWVVTPAFHPDGLSVSLADAFALPGMGALWCSSYLGRLARGPLLYQPQLESDPESLEGVAATS